MNIARRSLGAVVAGVLLAGAGAGPAGADEAMHLSQHSTNIACDAYVDGLTVSVGVNRRVEDGQVSTYANADIYNDDESVYATGETEDLTFSDGLVEATVRLLDHGGEPYGSAHLAGAYEVGEARVVPGRPLRLEGNQYQVTSMTVAEVTVDWQTLEVAGVELVRDGVPTAEFWCDGYDLTSSGVRTDPHRLSSSYEYYATDGPCAVGPLTVSVVPSEVGVTLELAGDDGLVGTTNFDPANPGTELLAWWLPDAEDPVLTDITLGLDRAGTPVTRTEVEQGATVRSTTQPMLLSLVAGLPDGTTVEGACAVQRVSSRFVVEPPAEES